VPVQQPIPVWVGAQSPRAYRRAGRLADGWFPQMAPGPQLDEARRIVAEAAAEAGRDPASLGMEGRVRWQQNRDELAAAMRQWRDADATHLSVSTMGAGLKTVDDHLAALATAAEAAKTISG
jgi:alkanesulfonate monooxygenase SsuD/methylene tetrahydromethanopterin reductase-like flavin-dependent oxidoreductase (luciferase family)